MGCLQTQFCRTILRKTHMASSPEMQVALCSIYEQAKAEKCLTVTRRVQPPFPQLKLSQAYTRIKLLTGSPQNPNAKFRAWKIPQQPKSKVSTGGDQADKSCLSCCWIQRCGVSTQSVLLLQFSRKKAKKKTPGLQQQALVPPHNV